jgi:hypothetical protein
MAMVGSPVREMFQKLANRSLTYLQKSGARPDDPENYCDYVWGTHAAAILKPGNYPELNPIKSINEQWIR